MGIESEYQTIKSFIGTDFCDISEVTSLLYKGMGIKTKTENGLTILIIDENSKYLDVTTGRYHKFGYVNGLVIDEDINVLSNGIRTKTEKPISDLLNNKKFANRKVSLYPIKKGTNICLYNYNGKWKMSSYNNTDIMYTKCLSMTFGEAFYNCMNDQVKTELGAKYVNDELVFDNLNKTYYYNFGYNSLYEHNTDILEYQHIWLHSIAEFNYGNFRSIENPFKFVSCTMPINMRISSEVIYKNLNKYGGLIRRTKYEQYIYKSKDFLSFERTYKNHKNDQMKDMFLRSDSHIKNRLIASKLTTIFCGPLLTDKKYAIELLNEFLDYVKMSINDSKAETIPQKLKLLHKHIFNELCTHNVYFKPIVELTLFGNIGTENKEQQEVLTKYIDTAERQLESDYKYEEAIGGKDIISMFNLLQRHIDEGSDYKEHCDKLLKLRLELLYSNNYPHRNNAIMALGSTLYNPLVSTYYGMDKDKFMKAKDGKIPIEEFILSIK